MGNDKKIIFQTLLYSDIFDFPLTKDEIYYYLISSKKISKRQFHIVFQQIEPSLIRLGTYYALRGREQILKKREKNDRFVHEKRAIAKKYARILGFIPTIYFIGISGGVAVGNADRQDDIDIFIITKKNCLFITRLLSLLILEIFSVRRRRLDTEVENTLCLNMFVDESALFLPSDMQDLYTAHEIAQIYPLLERKAMYARFLKKNAWMKKFLPHAVHGRALPLSKLPEMRIGEYILSFAEPIARFVQMLILKRHKTSEIVTDHMAAFHPRDYRGRTLQKYEQQISENYYAKRKIIW